MIPHSGRHHTPEIRNPIVGRPIGRLPAGSASGAAGQLPTARSPTGVLRAHAGDGPLEGEYLGLVAAGRFLRLTGARLSEARSVLSSGSAQTAQTSNLPRLLGLN